MADTNSNRTNPFVAMKKFVITKETFEGVIVLEYDVQGNLCLADLREAELTEVQIENLCRNLPPKIENIMPFCDKLKLKVVEQEIEITFEVFYTKFGFKKGKFEAEKAWNKISKGDQIKAYMYIGSYKRDLKLNTWKTSLYPASYLNKKRWED